MGRHLPATAFGLLFLALALPVLPFVDWQVCARLAVLLGVILFGQGQLWPGFLQWLVYPALWLLLHCWLSSLPRHGQRRLLAPVALVVALLCAAGGTRAPMACYHVRCAEAAQRSGDHATALEEYGRAWTGLRCATRSRAGDGSPLQGRRPAPRPGGPDP
ncbi:MAG: hypothetical protein AB1505_35950, partial [Candidatus Latescibacterota bacterium]